MTAVVLTEAKSKLIPPTVDVVEAGIGGTTDGGQANRGVPPEPDVVPPEPDVVAGAGVRDAAAGAGAVVPPGEEGGVEDMMQPKKEKETERKNPRVDNGSRVRIDKEEVEPKEEREALEGVQPKKVESKRFLKVEGQSKNQER